MYDELLDRVRAHADSFLESLRERHVGPQATAEELRDALGGPLPDTGSDPAAVIDDLAKGADAGLMGVAGPRFFGFVMGGVHPAGLAAEWLTTVWDQNAGLFAPSPAATIVEEISGRWLKELLRLPGDASFGFVTGGQMANLVGLAAARHHVLEQAGWDVEARGLQGAPKVEVIAGAESHVTIGRSLRFLGLGSETMIRVDADEQGRMKPDELERALARTEGPTIVCAQAGNVNTGSFDPLRAICEAASDRGAWVHVDGAFGLWAAASPAFAHLVDGVELADSWATDGHKWLNVPYDCGYTFCAHPRAHRGAMGTQASYLIQADEGGERDPMDWNPEFSRRARGFATYATLRALGRNGVRDLVERCNAHAARFAELLRDAPLVEVLNDVVLNQVLVRFLAGDGNHDRRTRSVIRGVQEEGTCWLSGSDWHGMHVMRISVVNWSTTTDDIDRSAEAILRVAAATP